MPFDNALPASLSPSRLADFQSCPRKYQHASIDRIPQPATYATAKGRFVHYILEQLMRLPPAQRTPDAARGFVAGAAEHVLTEDVRREINLDADAERGLLEETDAIIDRYFDMEDPRDVTSEGVELRLSATVQDTPLLGILDRLDRDADGSLVIVDYKTGAVPSRQYDSQTFANAEIYAVLCESELEERPTKMRLLYVTKGETLERPVSHVVIRARATAAAQAWGRINQYYRDGEFPATPSKSACRFCHFADRCRAAGVPVPPR